MRTQFGKLCSKVSSWLIFEENAYQRSVERLDFEEDWFLRCFGCNRRGLLFCCFLKKTYLQAVDDLGFKDE